MQAPSLASLLFVCWVRRTGFCHDFTQGRQRNGFWSPAGAGPRNRATPLRPSRFRLRTLPERHDPVIGIVSRRSAAFNSVGRQHRFFSAQQQQSLASKRKGAVGAFHLAGQATSRPPRLERSSSKAAKVGVDICSDTQAVVEPGAFELTGVDSEAQGKIRSAGVGLAAQVRATVWPGGEGSGLKKKQTGHGQSRGVAPPAVGRGFRGNRLA